MSPLAFLQQPYPGSDSWQRALLRSGLIGLFVGMFLLLFLPFGLDGWQTANKALKIAGFGGITFGVLLINSVLTPRLWPRFFAEAHWTVGKEIALILTHILLIAVANRFYLNWLLGVSGFHSWGSAIGMTFLIGIFPTVGVVVTNYIVQLRRYSEQATALSDQLTPVSAPVPAPPTAMPLTLTADNGKDTLTLAPTDLLAIESSDNYCTIHYLKNGLLTKLLMRSSLSRLEGQLPPTDPETPPLFVRCHRSYVVNLNFVDRVSGNAQGYKLHLTHGELLIPVARQNNDTLVRTLKEKR